MKRLIIALVLMVIALAACFGENLLIKHHYKNIMEKIKICEHQIDSRDFESAKLTADKIEKEWQDKEEVLTFFISKNHLKEISLAISQLRELATENSKDYFKAQCEQIKYLFTQIKNDEDFNFVGIL